MRRTLTGLLAAGLGAVLLGACGTPSTSSLPPLRTDRLLASCTPGRLMPRLVLEDTSPSHSIDVGVGGTFVVVVPAWAWGQATDPMASVEGTVREVCSVPTAGGGRRALFTAVRPGTTSLDATVSPASDAMMPAWSGTVRSVVLASAAVPEA